MPDRKSGTEQPGSKADDLSIDAPRLTPQGRTDPDAEGEDSTNPMGEGASRARPIRPRVSPRRSRRELLTPPLSSSEGRG